MDIKEKMCRFCGADLKSGDIFVTKMCLSCESKHFLTSRLFVL